MGGTLEFIQSFNNPEIIDASDSSLEKHCGWKVLSVSEISSYCLNCSLSGAQTVQ